MRATTATALAAAILALSLAPEARARVLPAPVQQALDDAVAAFAGAPGYSSVAPDTITGEGWWTVARFPHAAESVMPPDGMLSPVVKAVLMLEKQEPPLEHARYRITWRRVAPAADEPGVYADLVEIARFNLGPGLRDQLAASVPPERLAPPDAFGTGPDVIWHFAMTPIQGIAAHLVAAGRRVLPPEEAAQERCFDTACTAPAPVAVTGAAWEPVAPADPFEADYATDGRGDGGVALAADALLHRAGLGLDTMAAPAEAEHPVDLVISRNAAGQERNVVAILHEGQVRDDAISDIWLRRREAGPDTVDWSGWVEHWPGRN